MAIIRLMALTMAWFLLCALVIEPFMISPQFADMQSWEVAQASLQSVSDMQSALLAGPSEISMDHFRVLCLLYFGLPAMVIWVLSTLQCKGSN